MDTESTKRLLDILIENAARILRGGFGVNAAESAFFSVIELMKIRSELKAYFLERAGDTLTLDDPGRLDEGFVPVELLELVTQSCGGKKCKSLQSAE